MTLSSSFSARFGIDLWRPAETASIRVRAFAVPSSTFETEAEVSAKLYAFEHEPTPGVVTDRRPANIGPTEPVTLPGKWRWHSFENESRARYLWAVRGVAP